MRKQLQVTPEIETALAALGIGVATFSTLWGAPPRPRHSVLGPRTTLRPLADPAALEVRFQVLDDLVLHELYKRGAASTPWRWGYRPAEHPYLEIVEPSENQHLRRQQLKAPILGIYRGWYISLRTDVALPEAAAPLFALLPDPAWQETRQLIAKSGTA